MKNPHIFSALFTIGLAASVLFGCEPDDPTKPGNPLNERTTAVFNPNKNYGRMTDIDGNIYRTIKIGAQIWMAENLRTTHYRNGDTIPNILGNEEWNGLTTGAWCNYNNTNDLDTIATYGRLYNWYAVADSRGLAPEGWRVPTIADWTILIDYLGGDEIASNKMKEVGIEHWEDFYQSDNSSGFTAIPGGRRYLSNDYSGIGSYSVFWTSSEYDLTSAGFLYLFDFSSNVNKGINYKQNGYSLRLIKET